LFKNSVYSTSTKKAKDLPPPIIWCVIIISDYYTEDSNVLCILYSTNASGVSAGMVGYGGHHIAPGDQIFYTIQHVYNTMNIIY